LARSWVTLRSLVLAPLSVATWSTAFSRLVAFRASSHIGVRSFSLNIIDVV
jgi:hypothetical protein